MPAKHKGMSAAEKRERILRIFTERKEVFSYPQIEKEAEKVGIRRDVVKDILESLVSDNLVDTENLGTSKCYWALPSQALLRLQAKCVDYQEKLEQGKVKQLELEQQYSKSKIGREQTQERKDLEQNINILKAEFSALQKEINIKERFDPDRLSRLKKQTTQLKDELNQWTDDINQLKYYLKSQAGMNQEQLEQLGIAQDFDNI